MSLAEVALRGVQWRERSRAGRPSEAGEGGCSPLRPLVRFLAGVRFGGRGVWTAPSRQQAKV
jgi:hypothetical protein